jgi:hypothetical protein
MENKIDLEQKIEKLRKELSGLRSSQAIYDNEVKKALEQIRNVFQIKKVPTIEEAMDLIDKLEAESAELLKKAKKLSDDAEKAMAKYEKEKSNA